MMLLTMATLGLFSCSDKVTDDVTQTPTDGITDGYVSFSISMIGDEMRGSMRDATEDEDNFTPGTSDEYAITSEYGANVVFFFGNDDKFITKSSLQVLSKPEESNDGHYSNNSEYSFNARIRKDKGDQIAKCVLILNVNPTIFEDWGTKNSSTISDLMEAYDKKATLKYESYFTMSNTVYVKTNSGTGTSSYELQGPTTINDNLIYPTYEDAAKHKVTVHVERIAAKFTAEFGEEAGITDNLIKHGVNTNDDNKLHVRNSSAYDAKITETKWGVYVNGWAVNATETKTYWIKKLNDGTIFNNTPQTTEPKFGLWGFEYSVANKGWNDESRLRSYWAVDPHYNSSTDTYPQQYRNSGDNNIKYGTENAVLDYISYKDVTTDFSAGTTIKPQYAPENTFGAYTFHETNNIAEGDYANTTYAYKNDGYMRAATHILVAAQLLIGSELDATTTPTGEAVSDKWCYEGNYWVAEEDNKVPTELITYMVKQIYAEYNQTLYTDDKCTQRLDLENPAEDWDITNYFTLVSAEGIKGADGRVMLKYEPQGEKKLYKKGAENNTEITNDDLADVIKSAGTAKHFDHGKMYYAIPIRHMAPKKDAETISNVQYPHVYNIGSYGVVRNHWYKMTISGINQPGTPVDNPEDPIIPNDEPDEGGFIAFEIVIVPWHVIDWNVGL